MKDLVEDFIDRRFRQDSANLHWLNGNCLWFAIILQTRFPGGETFYLPVPGHFVYKYDGKFYDWHGIIKPFEPIIPFDQLKEQDKKWYDHLIRDCFQ